MTDFVHEALRNEHKDQPIWVVGADPTIVKFPKDFLRDKLSIVLGDAYAFFPDGTYNYNDEWKTVRDFTPRFPGYLTKQHIWAYPFFGMDEGGSKKFIEEYRPQKVWSLHYKPYPPHGRRNDILTGVGYNAMVELVHKANQGYPGPYGGFATCLHCALYSAIIMGCNPINIIACSHQIIDGYFSPPEIGGRRYSSQEIARTQKNWCRYAQRGTQAIMEGCRKEGISISRWDGGKA